VTDLSHTFPNPGIFTGQVAITDNGGATASGIVTICVTDDCGVCGGDGCSCLAGITSGECKTPLSCTGAQELGSCCSGVSSGQCVAGGGGGDLLQSTGSEHCLNGVCVGCVADAGSHSTTNLCGAKSFAFLVSDEVSFAANKAGLCADMQPFVGLNNRQAVLITPNSWSIVGSLLFHGSSLTTAYLNQFTGIFTVDKIGSRAVELKCLSTDTFPCHVGNIIIGVDPSFCFIEFNVGDRKRVPSLSLNSNFVLGGSLLNPNPFSTFVK